MSLTTGTTAPNFSLFDTDKNQVHLADQKGKNVVLLFFPLAFTGVCTTELCSIRDNIAVYNNTSATVFGVSVDSLFALGKFKEEQNLNFNLLSDESLDVHKLFGSYGEKMLYGRAYEGVLRSTCVIDEKGKVTLPLYNVKATGHVAMLRKQLGI